MTLMNALNKPTPNNPPTDQPAPNEPAPSASLVARLKSFFTGDTVRRKSSGPGWRQDQAPAEAAVDEDSEGGADRGIEKVRIRQRGRLMADRNQATTAHACSLYPFGTHEGLGQRGVFLGTDTLGGGGAFIYDPFHALESGRRHGVTNTNMMVLGLPGYGKSALIKTLLYRSAAVFGTERFTTICDVKGEYTELAEVCGFELIKLAPGGTVRVNPLEVIGEVGGQDAVFRSRFAALKALVEMSMQNQRSMTVLESSILAEALKAVAVMDDDGDQPTLSDVLERLTNPASGTSERLHCQDGELRDASRDIILILKSLISGPLGGMFDGQSTVALDPAGAGVVIDISAVGADPDALPLVWVAASTWLRMLMLRKDGRKKIQVFDESWKMMSHGPLAVFLQDCWKLMRSYGGANIAVIHKPGDLAAQADDGTAASKISAGLLADTAVRVTFKQTLEDLSAYADLLGYGAAEIPRIGDLGVGESFWKLGSTAVQLQHVMHGPVEDRLCDTNAAMATQGTQ